MSDTSLRALPTSVEAIRKLRPEFPRLTPDSPKGCPVSMSEIRAYLRAECEAAVPDLFFGRTASIGGVRFWLWGFTDGRGLTMFVDVGARGAKSRLNVASAQDLSAEQYLALQYARWWRES